MTCTCAIWSCGIVNSSAALGFFDVELVVAFESAPPQPAMTSNIAQPITEGPTHFQTSRRKVMADSSSPPLLSTAPVTSYKKRVPAGKPTAPTGSCARNPESPTSSQP